MGFYTNKHGANPLNKHRKKKIVNEWLAPFKDETNTLRINRFVASKYFIRIFFPLIFMFWCAVGNYIVNSITCFFMWASKRSNVIKDVSFGLSNALPFKYVRYAHPTLWVYLIVILLGLILTTVFVLHLRADLSDDYFNVGQKGKARFASIEEVKSDFIKIPCDGTDIDINPGTVVCGYTEKSGDRSLYVGKKPANTLVIGMTRSGKGEMYVFNEIDVQSRSIFRPSLVVNDPKMELFKSSKHMLEERGYECRLLKLDDPLHSMGYNELQLAIDVYKTGDQANAELLCQSFSYSVFNPDAEIGTEKFFASQGATLLTALSIAHIEDCLREDKIQNQKRLNIFKDKRKAFDKLSDEDKEKARKLILMKKNENKSYDYILDSKIKAIPGDIEFKFFETHENEKKIHPYSLISTFNQLASETIDDRGTTLLDEFFKCRAVNDRARMKYMSVEVSGDRTKASIYSTMTNKLGVFTYTNIAKMSCESSIKLEDIGFGDKPLAIFISTPDYDQSNHFLASTFIRQVYFILAQKATNTKEGHCKRPVKFICDEAGNMPAIENMSSIITVCLSRWISFTLYIQSFAQLDDKYKEGATTIKGNCSYHVYILTNDNSTTEEFSKVLGETTYINIQRSGTRFGFNKNITEIPEGKPLLSDNELKNLMEGECVVLRITERTDREGNPVRPNPIFCSRRTGTHLEYRYRDSYLSKLFPDPNLLSLDEVNLEDRSYIDLKSRTWNPMLSIKRHTDKIKDPEVEDIEDSNVLCVGDLNDDVKSQLYSFMENQIKDVLDELIKNNNSSFDDIPISSLMSLDINDKINVTIQTLLSN